jgi:hypothetical protein
VVVSDTHVITITQEPVCTPVSDVDLSTSGVIYSGGVLDLLVDIIPDDASKPYSYTVDYGSGTAALTFSSDDDPLALSHTFDSVGDYTISFAAWNCDLSQADAVTANLQVSIVESMPVIYLPLVIKGD